MDDVPWANCFYAILTQYSPCAGAVPLLNAHSHSHNVYENSDRLSFMKYTCCSCSSSVNRLVDCCCKLSVLLIYQIFIMLVESVIRSLESIADEHVCEEVLQYGISCKTARIAPYADHLSGAQDGSHVYVNDESVHLLVHQVCHVRMPIGFLPDYWSTPR